MFQILSKSVKGFPSCEEPKMGFPFDFHCRLTIGQHYRAACDIGTLFACMVGFPGSSDTNVLSKFSREQRELPWQPNLGQNKPKLH